MNALNALILHPYIGAGILLLSFFLGAVCGWLARGEARSHRHGSGDLIDPKNPDEDLM